MENKIYESPDKGETIYRRNFNEHTGRERISFTKQTAVDWLEKEYNEKGKLTPVDFFQAKEMEKQQLNIARLDGVNLANKGYGK